jgi:hypothetical protein
MEQRASKRALGSTFSAAGLKAGLKLTVIRGAQNHAILTGLLISVPSLVSVF